MILDSFKNSELYLSINPRLKVAFDFIANTDLAAMETGIHKIDGDDVFVNVMEGDLKLREDAKLEVHNLYADIQVLICGDGEDFGWSERVDVTKPQTDFNDEKDVQFFDDVPQTYYTLKKGQFTILLPEDAHAPMVGEGKFKKAIFKVRM